MKRIQRGGVEVLHGDQDLTSKFYKAGPKIVISLGNWGMGTRMRIPFYLPFVALLIGLTVAGCGRPGSPENTDTRLNQAARAIDEGRFDDAITAATEVAAAEPRNERASLMLASAYAGRAGIRVENFWGFLVGFDGFVDAGGTKLSVDVLGLRKYPLPASTKGQLLSQFREILAVLMALQKRIFQIPYLELQNREDLRHGIEALKDSESPGARLYRAILLMVLIRSGIEDTQKEMKGLEGDPDPLCNSQAGKSVEWFTYTIAHLLDMVLDLTRAFPNGLKEVVAVKDEITMARDYLFNQAAKGGVKGLREKLCNP